MLCSSSFVHRIQTTLDPLFSWCWSSFLPFHVMHGVGVTITSGSPHHSLPVAIFVFFLVVFSSQMETDNSCILLFVFLFLESDVQSATKHIKCVISNPVSVCWQTLVHLASELKSYKKIKKKPQSAFWILIHQVYLLIRFQTSICYFTIEWLHIRKTLM